MNRYMPPKLRWSILVRDKFRCTYCGRGVTEVPRLVVDHIVPWSIGGDDDPSNLTTACDDCNLGKADTVLPTIEIEVSEGAWCPTRWFVACMGVRQYDYATYKYTWNAIAPSMQASGYTMPPRDRRDGQVWEAVKIAYLAGMAEQRDDAA